MSKTKRKRRRCGVRKATWLRKPVHIVPECPSQAGDADDRCEAKKGDIINGIPADTPLRTRSFSHPSKINGCFFGISFIILPGPVLG